MPSNDVRYALRLMRRSPGFTAVAVLSLALGTGANTAIFSLFYTIMLRPLPVAHPEQLVEVVRNSPQETHWAGYWSWEQYEYFRDHNDVFSGLTGTSFDNLAAVRVGDSDEESLILEAVPGNYFGVLGMKPAIGRFPGPEDLPASGDGDVAVVSWSYWQRHFQCDAAILGKRILYNDAPKTIIGVVARGYFGPRVGYRTDVWLPVAQVHPTMLARLKAGTSMRQAQAEIDTLYHSLQQQGTARRVDRANIELVPAGAGLVRLRDQYGKPLALLMTVVGLLLLLACINLASMLLARAAGRQRELAVRVSLGASGGQLLRQMLMESMLLAAAGTAAGIVAAYIGTGALVRILAGARAFERVDIEVQPDLVLLLFTAGLALLTGLLFGIAPAWQAFHAAPATGLRQTGRGGDTRGWRLFAEGLVTAQVALSILLASAAAMFLSHLTQLRNFQLGFRSDHVLLVTLDPSRSGYTAPQLATRYRELLARMEAIPQVMAASVSGCTPLEGCGSGARYLKAEGHMERPEDRKLTNVVFASPRYFETLGIPLIAGREFSFGDVGRARVAIVNEMMARRYFPGVNPIGKHVTVVKEPATGGWFGTDEPYEIVGLAGDAKAVELRDTPYATMYFNMFQEERLNHQFEIRTSVNPMAMAGTVRRLAGEVLKTVPVKSVTTLAEQVDANIVPEHLISTLSEFFGCLGAALAGIGLYGLLAYTVARRSKEIGIRMALGATSGGVRWLVLRDALIMAGAGVAAGACLVLWSRPLALSVLHDLKWQPVAALGAGSVAVLAVAVLAAYVPVRRATRVDPVVALRHD